MRYAEFWARVQAAAADQEAFKALVRDVLGEDELRDFLMKVVSNTTAQYAGLLAEHPASEQAAVELPPIFAFQEAIDPSPKNGLGMGDEIEFRGGQALAKMSGLKFGDTLHRRIVSLSVGLEFASAGLQPLVVVAAFQGSFAALEFQGGLSAAEVEAQAASAVASPAIIFTAKTLDGRAAMAKVSVNLEESGALTFGPPALMPTLSDGSFGAVDDLFKTLAEPEKAIRHLKELSAATGIELG